MLAALPEQERERLWPLLAWGELQLKSMVLSKDAQIDAIVFPETGTVSMLADLEDGARIEVGLIGHEGAVGFPLMLGVKTSQLDAMVQVIGNGLHLPARSLKAALGDAPSLSGLLFRYVDAFLSQVSQTAACNGRHHIDQRLARWILMTHDRVDGDAFQMTHEFLSTMLGVQRPGVSLAIGGLKRTGLVQHDRGVMTVVDRSGLEAVACECYARVRRKFEWLH